jgi:hypothetical protein
MMALVVIGLVTSAAASVSGCYAALKRGSNWSAAFSLLIPIYAVAYLFWVGTGTAKKSHP